MSRYLMGILAAVALIAAVTSEAAAQIAEGLNDLLFGPLRDRQETTAESQDDTIPLEEAGRLVQLQSPNLTASQTTSAQSNAATVDPQAQPTIDPAGETNNQPAAPASPTTAPVTGEAPDSIPALW